VRNEVMMDQFITLHEPNKKVINRWWITSSFSNQTPSKCFTKEVMLFTLPQIFKSVPVQNPAVQSPFTARFWTDTTKPAVMGVHISADSYKPAVITIFFTAGSLHEPAVFCVANTVSSCDQPIVMRKTTLSVQHTSSVGELWK